MVPVVDLRDAEAEGPVETPGRDVRGLRRDGDARATLLAEPGDRALEERAPEPEPARREVDAEEADLADAPGTQVAGDVADGATLPLGDPHGVGLAAAARLDPARVERGAGARIE